MSRKPKKGYFVRGQFVAEGSELDQELKAELRGDGPSKTELKVQSTELQTLGEALLTLRRDLFEPLDLPTRLTDALDELARITHFEGKRRQKQYVGKLMRQLNEDQIVAIRAALDMQRQGSAADTLRLHEAERWRERLIDADAAIREWITQYPATDVQQLRALVRQARKDAHLAANAPATQARGQAPRQSRAYRELFQMVRHALAQAEAPTGTDADSIDAVPNTD